MKPTTSMNSKAWWFVDNKIVLIVLNDINLQV